MKQAALALLVLVALAAKTSTAQSTTGQHSISLPLAATQEDSQPVKGLAFDCTGSVVWYRRLVPGSKHRPCNPLTRVTDAEQLLLAQQQQLLIEQQQQQQQQISQSGNAQTAQATHSTTAAAADATTGGNPIVLGALSTAQQGDSDGEVDYYGQWHEDYVFPEETIGSDIGDAIAGAIVTPAAAAAAAAIVAAIEAAYDAPLPDYDYAPRESPDLTSSSVPTAKP